MNSLYPVTAEWFGMQHKPVTVGVVLVIIDSTALAVPFLCQQHPAKGGAAIVGVGDLRWATGLALGHPVDPGVRSHSWDRSRKYCKNT